MTLLAHAALLAAWTALVVLAGAGVARRALREAIDEESRVLAALLCGMTLVAGAALVAWTVGAGRHAGTAAILALAACVPLLRGGGLGELRGAIRASWGRWAVFLVVALAATAVFHGRQIVFTQDGGIAWRGTLGWESFFHAALSDALLRGEMEWPTGEPAGPVRYHVLSHLVAGLVSKGTGAESIEVYARLLPPLLFAVAFEAHRYLLRAWMPRSWALAAAAILPLLVTDLDPWLRLLGGTPVDRIDNRTGHSFVVSPSFVAGQAFACFVVGAAVRLGHAGRARTVTAAALGVLLGTLVGWKLPSALVAAVAVGAIAPWLVRHCGRRALVIAACTALLAGGLTWWACFAEGPGTAARPVPVTDIVGAWPGAALLAGSAWWILQTLGPRLLRVGTVARMLHADASVGAVVVPALVCVVVAAAVRLGPGDEQKYLVRCGTYGLLLVTGAIVFRDCVTPGRRTWGWASVAILALFCAGQVREALRSRRFEGEVAASEWLRLRLANHGDLVTIGYEVQIPRDPDEEPPVLSVLVGSAVESQELPFRVFGYRVRRR